MQTHILGYPRIGSNRELKKACEQYWSGKITLDELLDVGKNTRQNNWKLQQEAGIDLIPCNDFSFYDQVLDMTLTLGAIPERYEEIALKKSETDLYFVMARGFQKEGLDITAMEMTKWFDTNYHFIVPEFHKNQEFKLFSRKIINEFLDAKQVGINVKPVIIGLLTYILLGKEKEEGFNKLELAQKILPVYIQILKELETHGAEYIQFDEPFLALDLDEKSKETYSLIYTEIRKQFPHLKIIVATYFECLRDNLSLAVSLPVNVLHLDLVRCPEQLEEVLKVIPETLHLSLGVIDGRNIWKNDFEKSLRLIRQAAGKIGSERILIAPSCSLLHSPSDLDLENNESVLSSEIKQWMAFAKQKVSETVTLKKLAAENPDYSTLLLLAENKKAIESRKTSPLIHNSEVKDRVDVITEEDAKRNKPFSIRKVSQQDILNLPLFPTTTIGSFPQTKEVRNWRAKFKKGELNAKQ
ncbi:5-methyltetrahydropteroyltriglutamate--homocysteine methyltransferase [Chryseobacterium gambrini]|uniref:5-methyltetrahydropteroyltriglutamate--homocysteine S-methyltransferase n=1 Tax=Chryseobacterium gambrini TaxID=373672 RepID=A0A1N7JTF2_9FLAO|nr:5-methyltetrahydropteroyltriglutamate--homocysteine methyltransferase [Chryseobacterium gambrini]